MWVKKFTANTPMGSKGANKRIFKGGIRNQSHTLLLLAYLHIKDNKTGIAQ